MELFGIPVGSMMEWIPAGLGAITSIIIFLLFLKRRMARFITKIRDIARRFSSHESKLDELSAKMSVVLAEVTPNGGSSIKDVVKRIEHRLYELELTSLTVLDHEQRGVFKTNAAGEIVWANRACAQVFDRGRDDLLRYGWLSCVVAESRSAITDEWESAVHLQRQVSVSFDIDTTSGERRELILKGYPILGNNQIFLGYIGTVNTSS